jgi:CRISPR type I-E-associated protein CasB/Cse2
LARIGALEDKSKALIASLYAVCHREGDLPHFSEEFNLGRVYFNALKGDKKDYKPQEHDTRFKVLIASESDDLFFRLRQVVKQIKSKNYEIDFSILLGEIYNWEHETRWVQRKWVSGFYSFDLDTDREEGKGEKK